jgi:hypothetical protein
MTEFTVFLANRPGMLALLTERLGDAGVNIEALAAFGLNETGLVRLIVDDATTTERVLDTADIGFEQRDILTTILPDRPGAMGAMARRLADAEVNIDAVYLLRSSAEGLEFAVAVDELPAARLLLAAS